MSFGRLLGGAAGFFLGGPAGAALGMGLGGAAEEALGGGETGAIRDASRAQSEAANRAIDLQREMFNKQLELGRPYQVAGEQALNKLIPLATEYTPFGMQQFQADPGYGFRLSEGQKALERSAAARGGLLSGATLKATQRFGQDLGSQEYMNAFNRYQTEREARLNPLQSLAGVGQTASNRLSDTAGTFGRSVGGMYIDQGSNSANAMLAAQRARGSAYGQLGSALGGYLGGGGGGFGRGGQMDELRGYGVF
jgi:hypothetical protein